MVTGTDRGKLGAVMTTPDFKSIAAGVGENLGGDNLGPTPHEYLEAALAACTVITVKMYAERKNMPLIATHVKVASQDNKLTRIIRFEGNLAEAEQTRLLEIANKCPIHKLLSGKIEISTALGDV